VSATDEHPEVQSPHARRFSVFTGALFAFAAIVLVGAAIIVSNSNDPEVINVDLSWSQFQPESKGPDQGAREIADFVGREYRLGSGQQLVAVTGGPLEVQGLPINIALRQSVADGGDINLLPGNGVLYRMCGLGKDCAIDRGKASQARHLLLRREALELAMYSFRFLRDTENVVVFMPKAPKSKTTQALFFQKEDLAPLVKKPLEDTISAPVPTPSTVKKSRGANDIDRLTMPRLYNSSLTQANEESSVFLVLDPLPSEPALVPGNASKGLNPAPAAGANGSGAPSSSRGSASAGTTGAPTTGSLNTPLSPTEPRLGRGK
jgi:hypothetical protein